MRVVVIVSAALVASGSGWSSPALASDYGCQVLLCLSNPGGPTQYGACAPPIYRLWRDLALGRSFPTCIGSGVSNIRVRGRQGSASYRVEMSYDDGRRQTFPLSGIDGAAAMANSDLAAPSSAVQQ